MSVFGGMSKGERNRIKIRVRTAMASQTQVEGRFLGGRPPYGYTFADLGPHPHPAKAADGRRLHGLVPDEITATPTPTTAAEVYRQLGLRLTYHPEQQKVRVQAQPVADSYGDLVLCPEIDTNQ